MKGESKHINKMRKNPWIVATLILSITALILMVGNYMDYYQRDWRDNVCYDMQRFQVGTPSFFDGNGNLVKQGALIVNQSIDFVNELLVPNNITMVYSESCGWCKKQIEYFGTTWEDYKDSGLTLRCG